MKNINTFNIFGIEINKLSNEQFLDFVNESIKQNQKHTIGYANADTLNKIYEDSSLKKIFSTFDLIHPDGIGVYMASGLLYGKNGLESRLTGSDFYPILIKESIKNNWKLFFFGHTEEILMEIKKQYPLLNISGTNEGYNFDNKKVIDRINESDPHIIIIGLSCPYQEKWMYENKDKISFNVMLAVGDGIKVFAGKKNRGPVIFRKLGLEWLTRLILSPFSNFRKYMIGIPLFIFRISSTKLRTK